MPSQEGSSWLPILCQPNSWKCYLLRDHRMMSLLSCWEQLSPCLYADENKFFLSCRKYLPYLKHLWSKTAYLHPSWTWAHLSRGREQLSWWNEYLHSRIRKHLKFFISMYFLFWDLSVDRIRPFCLYLSHFFTHFLRHMWSDPLNWGIMIPLMALKQFSKVMKLPSPNSITKR